MHVLSCTRETLLKQSLPSCERSRPLLTVNLRPVLWMDRGGWRRRWRGRGRCLWHGRVHRCLWSRWLHTINPTVSGAVATGLAGIAVRVGQADRLHDTCQ